MYMDTSPASAGLTKIEPSLVLTTASTFLCQHHEFQTFLRGSANCAHSIQLAPPQGFEGTLANEGAINDWLEGISKVEGAGCDLIGDRVQLKGVDPAQTVELILR